MIYGKSYQEICTKIHKKALSEWSRHEELIEDFQKLAPHDQESGICILEESIACCRRSLGHYTRILKEIASNRAERDQPWWVELKKTAKQGKNFTNAEIDQIQAIVLGIRENSAMGQVQILYEESKQKIDLANIKIQDCPRSLHNADIVVATLNEAANLYEEAAQLLHRAYAHISPYSSEAAEAAKKNLEEIVHAFIERIEQYKREAAEWPASIAAQKATLKKKIATLKEDSRLFKEKGLKRSSYELQKQAVLILEQLIESRLYDEEDLEELSKLKTSITLFETQADNSRLTESTPMLSEEEFRAKEDKRREVFFENSTALKRAIHQTPSRPRPFAIALDGQTGKTDKQFTLYTEQFYRFLVQSNTPVSHLLVKVLKQGELLYEEKIALPLKNTLSWERYLTTDGLVFIPETKLKTDFGLDLRLNFVCDFHCNFSLIIAQKSLYSDYQLSISLDEEEPLYECTLSEPPPWQLRALCKPGLPHIDRCIGKTLSSPFSKNHKRQLTQLEPISFPDLDQLVEDLKSDPLALAQYVYHEIALKDPFALEEQGIFQAPGIQRTPYMTYLEKEGSAWEQCQLLVYLLRKAGYQANCVTGLCILPKDFVEKMLFTRLIHEQKEAFLQYPWVVFSDEKEVVSLFPWMKEMQIGEGHDLYNFLPEEYASADRFVLRYLKGDERILKHIGPDGDDTAGLLFSRFAEENLRKQGLSLADVGIHRTPLKKQFASWSDFPRPIVQGKGQILDLDSIARFSASAIVEISSSENPEKRITQTLPLASFNRPSIPIWFEENRLHTQLTEETSFLDLDATDHRIEIKVNYTFPIGSYPFITNKSLFLEKGTTAALCFHLGSASPKKTIQLYQQFSSEKEEKKRLQALLSFVGASYFEKCGRAEQLLADLHKVNPKTVFAFGLATLVPDSSKADVMLPQVNMVWNNAPASLNPHSNIWNQELNTARMQFETLLIVDTSSNEHQILREVFKDPYAISTVKLLQLAHQQQQKKGETKEGFLVFTPSIFAAANQTPEAAQSLYFSHLRDLNLRDVKKIAHSQWNAIQNLFEKPFSDWAYAYMTPGLTTSQDSTYEETGTLIIHPCEKGGLISYNKHHLRHGGLGSALPADYLYAIRDWQLVPTDRGYELQFPSLLDQLPYILPPQAIPDPTPQSIGTTIWSPDVRLQHKSIWNAVSDPVDTVTGAFYVDEVDLFLPGTFPLEIRRNHNSQNPLIGDFGCGWKLSLNPSLIHQEGKLYAAEADGTIITYSFNQETTRWEVFPEDNPDLCNHKGISSNTNPFHAYIQDDILYGADGSKRIFEDGLLKKWINTRGNTLTFSYNENRLSRIESSNGDFCGLHYNHEGKISEIYAKDGRRISYNYNSQADLVQVTLPNTATISYEYDRFHRIIRETRPHGKILENIYDQEGRVIEQRSPMGLDQQMITTATFTYQEGITTVTDACIADARGGTTTYKIFQKQIYKIIDPLGHQTLQAWFIDKHSWFDPEAEQIVEWNQEGGAPRSLKSSTDKRGLTTYYLYDSQGNVEEIGLKGQDLTGDGETVITKRLTYNAQNLCIQEETFPYLPQKIEKYNQNNLLSYIALEYNAIGQIEKEDHSGAVTLWKYETRGFPYQKTQITGTNDPNIVTTYSHNNQGQCIQTIAVDGIQENTYDIMGNVIESLLFSPSGSLISATYTSYNLNCDPIWKQTANSTNTLRLDYHASGLLKATSQNLNQNVASQEKVAYTIYEYDPRGYLIQEVDPRGCCTYRDYDLLGKVLSETKEEHTTLYSYEPGGLLQTITTPSGAQTTRLYTTNGLLKEEHYPDGTKSSIIYDFFGRPILETKNGISWEIQYNGHKVTRTHLETKATEIQEFDPRGNLIQFTDAAGYIHKKTYDNLNRLKTEITPSGEQTTWVYDGNIVICLLPNGEIIINRYEAGKIVETATTDSNKRLIASSSFHYDPITDRQDLIQGEETTTTWMNVLGLPIKVQKAEITTTHEYDACGNCITSIDGDGRVTRQKFDGLSRLIQKELPDKNINDACIIKYIYDLDSNLIECHLPNLVVWKATYDSMSRKRMEEIQAGRHSSQHWEFTYENGYLTNTKDPLQRIHTYLYDSHGRLIQDIVDGCSRTYTYDPRGYFTSVEQQSGEHNSLIERSYDSDGHLNLESIFLDSHLLQQTHQKWTPNNRSIEIDDHERHFTYQNKQLAKVLTQDVALSYSYGLSGALNRTTNPFITTTIHYNQSPLPESIHTQLPDSSYRELLRWYPSGKLNLYSKPGNQKVFSYNSRGYLASTGTEEYEFGVTGVRTAAPNWHVPQDGLDPFGKIITEISHKKPLTTTYDPMGQVTSHGQKQLEWDPWGKLLKVTDKTSTWEATYDALGRRLQTRYTNENSTLTTTSLYDPEEEFQEIGIKYADKTLWKIYGPNSCDAISDESETVFLAHNALGQLTAVVSAKKTHYAKNLPSVYGQSTTPIPSDLLSYAQSLTWHSKAQDPTDLIWMGERYYDPNGGRFLSPDPISYPNCLDLYTYANSDPINFIDPSGRFASPAYQVIKTSVISTLSNPHFQGSIQALGGFAEASAGALMTFASFGGAAPMGFPVMAHGLDHFFTGMGTVFSGEIRDTATSQLLQRTGMSAHTADLIDNSLSMAGTLGGASAIRFGHLASSPKYRLPAKGAGERNNLATLYRAVKPDELADIQRTGIFRNLGDAEGKYFTTSIEGASSYAKQAVKGFCDPPYTLIKTRVPSHIFSRVPPTLVDGRIPAWIIPDQRLKGLIPEIVPWMAVPK